MHISISSTLLNPVSLARLHGIIQHNYGHLAQPVEHSCTTMEAFSHFPSLSLFFHRSLMHQPCLSLLKKQHKTIPRSLCVYLCRLFWTLQLIPGSLNMSRYPWIFPHNSLLGMSSYLPSVYISQMCRIPLIHFTLSWQVQISLFFSLQFDHRTINPHRLLCIYLHYEALLATL